MVSVEVKQHLGSERVNNYGLCGRKATLNSTTFEARPGAASKGFFICSADLLTMSVIVQPPACAHV